MSLADTITKTLRTIHDPEIPVNIHDLGLIYDLAVDSDGAVKIQMTLTAPNCPMAEQIVADVRNRVAEVDGVTSVEVELVWDPKWDPDMMTEAAKLELEFTGHTGPAHLRKDKFTSLSVRRKKKNR